MARSPDVDAGTESGLAQLGRLAPEEAGRRIDGALARAARLATAEGAALDGSVVGALLGCAERDAILDRVDLEALLSLLERVARRAPGTAEAPGPLDARRATWEALDVVRRPAVLRRVPREHVGAWASALLAAIEASDLAVGPLFRERARRYGSKTLFETPRGRRMSWRRVALEVDSLARGLLALDESGEPGPVAVLSENRVEMALVDLACLTAGIVDVLVPANATAGDVAFILRHAGVRTVVVSNAEQLRKVEPAIGNAPQLRHLITIDPPGPSRQAPHPLSRLAETAGGIAADLPRRRGELARVLDLATVMYTSGTTGQPKGIRFSHRNLVFKRFARALALPEIGEDDRFLCYLPLYHTFGRFLELLGCIFWGATYRFMHDTSPESMVRDMRLYHPTVFISVPKKWIQLHAAITRDVDVASSDEELRAATQSVTGGRLRWGLSAAGHLDPEIFRTLQQSGVELLSGFGMTEATGGITMTRPGEYREGSLGTALPGIELKLAEDGELLIRGPYVMMGYLDPPDGESGIDADGWFHTGDLMEADEQGHLRLVDRKKEIYKNVKGETISPQRVENLFRDLESVGRVFLVGDHREYNTLLVYPNPECEEPDFSTMTPEATHEHFRSIVASVNKFLAPFERIVAFAVIDRNLDAARGELTPKGTPRRQAIVRNFDEVIRRLYRRTQLRVGGADLALPNWWFQMRGLTAGDIRVEADAVRVGADPAGLTVRRVADDVVRVGDSLYRHPPGAFDLGAVLRTPELWLGNGELVRFAGVEAPQPTAAARNRRGVEWLGRERPHEPDAAELTELEGSIRSSDWQLADVDRAARVLGSADAAQAMQAVRLLGRVAAEPEGPLAGTALAVLHRCATADDAGVRRRAFQLLVTAEKDNRLAATLERFLLADPAVLDAETRALIGERDLSEGKVEAFLEFTGRACSDPDPASPARPLAAPLLEFLASYGGAHPARYRRLRAFLVRMSRFGADAGLREEAARQVRALEAGFRQWLGAKSRIAVDPETGQEYRWEDVVVFGEDTDPADRERLLGAIRGSVMLREAVFLISRGAEIRLSDIPPGGVWIKLLGARHGKAVYRVTVHTRFQGSHDLAVNVNHALDDRDLAEEIEWLILAGDFEHRDRLVEDFGGFWPEHGLWTEEYVAGDPLSVAMRRLRNRTNGEERLRQLWPFLVWTALSAYVDFWDRSGRTLEVADPGMSNVVVPTDDYHTGVRLVSISIRRPHESLVAMMRSFMEEFVRPAEESYPFLAGLVAWDVVFSSVLEVAGESAGLALLREALASRGPAGGTRMREALQRYVETVEVRGFLPRRLFFAAKRYRRWARLSPDATSQARAATLQELYATYGLERLSAIYPETRVRFFLETVFRGGPPELTSGLEGLVARIRARDLPGDELIDAVADLNARLQLGPDDEYFMARLSLPYLTPEDSADFVSSRLGGRPQSEIVVNLEDREGRGIRVRHALQPKEVERLHRLFLAAKVDVRFGPEHRYLLALNDRDQIVGGIYYAIAEDGENAHLEKIVVSELYRRKGVADGLMKQFFNRMRAAGVRTVTTGFFRPEYFYAYGFRVEKRYAGLVKALDDEE